MTVKQARKVRVKPFQDQVLILPIEESDVTEGGIVLVSSRNKEKPTRGIVVAVGPGKLVDGQLVPPDVKEGQTVVFSQYAGTEIEIDEVKHKLVRFNPDVLAALEWADEDEPGEAE